MGFNPGHAQEVENLLVNGGFEDGVISPWTIWSSWGDVTREVVKELVNAAVPEDPIEGDFCLHLVVPTPPGVAYWECCLQNGGHVFEKGKKYTHSAFFKCKKGRMQIGFELQIGQDPWTVYSEQVFTITDEWAEYSLTSPVFIEDVSPGNVLFRLAFEVGDFWVDGVRFYEGDYVPPVFKPRVLAERPSPEDGAVDVPRDTALSWGPGPFADTHNVYFGAVFDDVNNADSSNTRDVLVSKGQTATRYDPEGLIEFNQTYYWRIDEVNTPPDSTAFKGDVWSFTTEPYAYPIANITATASSSNSTDMGPEKTVDGSGLNASDRHSVEPTDMWLSSVIGPQPTWIQFEFDRTYKLLEMWVWNSNQLLEAVIGFGAKDVTIEYSEDSTTWTSLGDVEFARAPGSADYAHDTTVDMAGALAKFVKLTINSNWAGLLPQYGLSEVLFFYIPVQAREPKPISGGKGVERNVVLDWRAGREAASHEVSFSSDKDAVINGTAPVDMATESRYEPGLLDFGQTYYWKVNEVNEAASTPSWEGNLWSFSTIEYFVVEDFEDYNAGNNEIWWAWIDGLGYASHPTLPAHPGNGTGSMVGDETTGSYMEETIIHGGNQAMPLFYDNNQQDKFKYSEAELILSGDKRDWAVGCVTELSLWFRGEPDNAAETLYVSLNGSALVSHENPDAALVTKWTQWNIPLQEFADQGVNLTNVNTIALGLGDKTNPQPGGSGKMYFDDITVGNPIPPVGLVAHFALENNAQDSSGNSHHGTVVGDPVYVDGPAGLGMALEFDGTGIQYVALGTFNPSEVTDKLSVSLWAKWNGLTSFWQGLIGKRDTWVASEMMWQIEANQTTGVVRFQREGIADIQGEVLPIGEWAHVAATFDGTTGKIYINGQMVGEGAFSFGSDPQAAIQFGACQANGGNSFNGSLDDIRIYDIVLSEAEVLELAGLIDSV